MAGKRTKPAPSDATDGAPRRAARASEHTASVAALVIARDAARRVAATVRAATAMPGVDLVLVVDDGSHDQTQDVARRAGAVVVRHSHPRGRAAAIETGASVVAMRDDEGRPPRHLLLLGAEMGDATLGAAPLVAPIVERVTDLAVAVDGSDGAPRPAGMAVSLARSAIKRTSGWAPVHPLSRVRCLTRAAMEAALPLSRGAGLEVGMTLDILHAGYSVSEVACDIRLPVTEKGLRGPVRSANHYRDVMVAISSRGIKGGLSATQDAMDRTLHRRNGDDE